MVRNFVVSITRSAISLSGTALAVAALVLMLSLFVLEQFGFEGGPYLGILTYLILPMILVVGLILIPIGAVLWRRKASKMSGGEGSPTLPIFDLNVPKTRHWLLIFLAATMVNIVILSTATYKGIEVMESPRRCPRIRAMTCMDNGMDPVVCRNSAALKNSPISVCCTH